MKRQYLSPFIAIALIILTLGGCSKKTGQDEMSILPTPTVSSIDALVIPQNEINQDNLSETPQQGIDAQSHETPLTTDRPVTQKVESDEKSPEASSPTVAPRTPMPTLEATPTPTAEKPKSIYDAPFDADAIKSAMIAKGRSMGMTYQSGMTPDNASWEMPVTASPSFQGDLLKNALMDYVSYYTSSNVAAYGGEPIKFFSVSYKETSDGYTFYFLH